MNIGHFLTRVLIGVYFIASAAIFFEGMSHPEIAKLQLNPTTLKSVTGVDVAAKLRTCCPQTFGFTEHPKFEFYLMSLTFMLGVLSITFSRYFHCIAPWYAIIQVSCIGYAIYKMEGDYTYKNFYAKKDLVDYLTYTLVWAGMVMWTPSYPFDILKTLYQVDNLDKPKYHNIRQSLRTLIAENGTGGLFRGISPCLVRAAPANAAIFSGFELGMRGLNSFE